MADKSIGIIMNGASGRMGYRQHLVRSILAIRDQGGVLLGNGERIQVEPLLVGRSEAKLAELARRHGIADYTTDLDAALADPRWEIYADFLVTKARAAAIRRAIAAGKAIYTEKPTAESLDEALELADLAKAAGIKNGVVHDKLYLPGLRKLARLIDSGFFGRILSVRGEFGYWVFEGDWQQAQRPSWNYRAEDGGGIVIDMFPHWNYVLENLFGRVRSVYARAATHIPHPLRRGRPAVLGDRRRRGLCGVRTRRRCDRSAELQLGRAGRPRGTGRVPGRRHPRQRRSRPVRVPHPAAQRHPQARLEPRPRRQPRLRHRLDGGPRQRRVRERVQDPVGAVHPTRAWRTPRTSSISSQAPAVSVWPRPA